MTVAIQKFNLASSHLRLLNVKPLKWNVHFLRFYSVSAPQTSDTTKPSQGAPSGKGILVQKYGGTSLGTPEKLEKVTNIISKFHTKENNVVAVVSAFSSETKAEGTTSRLLAAADAAVSAEPFSQYLDRIEDTHLDIVYGLLKTKSIREDTKRFVTDELGRVRQFCDSLSVIQELSPRSHDNIIGCGERLAAGVLSGVLRENGIDSAMVDLSTAFPQGIDCSKKDYQEQAKLVFRPMLQPLIGKNIVPVVTGFFGNVMGGIIRDVGRGYTDLTAALCAASLKANQLQVWKESDGVFTGNPTKIKNASLINLVAPAEAAELTYFGNEVLHPFTMSCAINNNVPIAILNTFKPDGLGTQVVPATLDELRKRKGKFGIAAVCSKNNIPMLNLSNRGQLDGYNYLNKVFFVFAKYKVKADLISTSMNNLTVTLHESTPRSKIDSVMTEVAEFCYVELEEKKAIVSCIGQGMRHQQGLAAKVFDCLSRNQINIEMISQGASEINISLVIDEKDMNKAIHCIHQDFLE